jgi:hypothetical protein
MEHAQQEEKGFPCRVKSGSRGCDSLVVPVLVIFTWATGQGVVGCSRQHDGTPQQTSNPHKLKAGNELHSNPKKHEQDHNSSYTA